VYVSNPGVIMVASQGIK